MKRKGVASMSASSSDDSQPRPYKAAATTTTTTTSATDSADSARDTSVPLVDSLPADDVLTFDTLRRLPMRIQFVRESDVGGQFPIVLINDIIAHYMKPQCVLTQFVPPLPTRPGIVVNTSPPTSKFFTNVDDWNLYVRGQAAVTNAVLRTTPDVGLHGLVHDLLRCTSETDVVRQVNLISSLWKWMPPHHLASEVDRDLKMCVLNIKLAATGVEGGINRSTFVPVDTNAWSICIAQTFVQSVSALPLSPADKQAIENAYTQVDSDMVQRCAQMDSYPWWFKGFASDLTEIEVDIYRNMHPFHALGRWFYRHGGSGSAESVVLHYYALLCKYLILPAFPSTRRPVTAAVTNGATATAAAATATTATPLSSISTLVSPVSPARVQFAIELAKSLAYLAINVYSHKREVTYSSWAGPWFEKALLYMLVPALNHENTNLNIGVLDRSFFI